MGRRIFLTHWADEALVKLITAKYENFICHSPFFTSPEPTISNKTSLQASLYGDEVADNTSEFNFHGELVYGEDEESNIFETIDHFLVAAG